MKTALLLVCASALAASAEATSVCAVSPGTWCEQPVNADAGQFLPSAQQTVGIGSLNTIIGGINGTGGADLFALLIPNTAAFSASFGPAAATGITGETDAAIFLLGPNGNGIEAAEEGTSLAGFSGTGGVYFVGITGQGNWPEYASSGNNTPIFSAFAAGQISFPVAGAGALSDYTGTGCGAACAGEYDISLAGAQYASTPEPASLALTGSVITALGLLCRFRRRT